jgi:transcriptional regulator with XRE-family HTH domain
MNLARYLSSKEISDEDFAPLIGVDRATVNRLRRGRHRPSWETIEKIQAATKGAVTANDFLNEPI